MSLNEKSWPKGDWRVLPLKYKIPAIRAPYNKVQIHTLQELTPDGRADLMGKACFLAERIEVVEANARPVRYGLLITIDLGPNPFITVSLATILWLHAIRCESQDVAIVAFLEIGTITMIPAPAAALHVWTL
jgi:Na+/H+ antiporter NhaD/arsenite permease-like protein